MAYFDKKKKAGIKSLIRQTIIVNKFPNFHLFFFPNDLLKISPVHNEHAQHLQAMSFFNKNKPSSSR